MKTHSKDQNTISIILASIYTILTLLVRLISGSPFDMLHKFNTSNLLPPIWLFNLCSLFWAFIIVYAAGIIINQVSCGKCRGKMEICSYKGGLFFVSVLFLSLIWYPVFFIAERPFIALIVSLSMAICSALCAFFWSGINRIAALIVAAYTLWSSYIVFINLSVLFQN